MEIDSLVTAMRSRGGELPGVEVKSAAGGLPDSITETMSAFANLPGGGLIVLGLDEAAGFQPVALKNAVALAAGVVSRARQASSPRCTLTSTCKRSRVQMWWWPAYASWRLLPSRAS